MLNVWNKINIYNSILRAVFISEFCFRLNAALQHGRLKKKIQLLLVSSTSRPNLLCFGFDLNQSQSSKPISRNGYGPDWLLISLYTL